MGLFDKLFGKPESTETPVTKSGTTITEGEMAAIAMALYQMNEDIHDVESNVITIKRIERRYSPWSSKIYGLNNLVR